MNVNLTQQLEEYVQQEVASGRFNNASEVVRDALRMHEERKMVREAKLAWLRGAIEEGLASPVAPWEGATELIRKAQAERDAKLAAQQG